MTDVATRAPSPSNGHSQRPLPHNLQAEEALLGALLFSRDVRDVVTSNLKADAFYKPAHADVYEAIVKLHDDGQPVDPTTVAEQLRRTGQLEQVGGQGALVGFQAVTPAVASGPRYAAIVQDHKTLREVIGLTADLSEDAYALPDDLTGLRMRTEQMLELLDRHTTRSGACQFAELLDAWVDDMNQRASGDQGAITTGFGALDKALGGGFHPGQLIVVAGRTSMGKTAVAGAFALNAARADHTVLVCSIEMAALELADRWVSATSKVPLATIRTGDLQLDEWQAIEQAMKRLAPRPIWVDDHDEISVSYVRGLARSLPQPPSLIIVDYLQLLRPAKRFDNRQEAVADISSTLKKLARRLQVPIVALAQLNRSAENRQDKRPQLTDLRESGSIENDADVVIGLYRDRYYNRPAKNDDADPLEAIIMKQRSGPLATVTLEFAADISAVLNPPGEF